MPSDFGDDTGEKMTDWMIEACGDEGAQALETCVMKLSEALKNVRTSLEATVEIPKENTVEQVQDWARLSMQEFEELPAYEGIKEVIEKQLSSDGIRHEFAVMDGSDQLVFMVEDASALTEAIVKLENQVKESTKAARERMSGTPTKEGGERLAERAQAAREAASALGRSEEPTHEVMRTEVRSK